MMSQWIWCGAVQMCVSDLNLLYRPQILFFVVGISLIFLILFFSLARADIFLCRSNC